MNKIAVIIPCYKVSDFILDVIKGIGSEVNKIYVVDDCCPDKSGKLVKDKCKDKRVTVIFNKENLGVGGAVIEGYKKALKDGADILVKIDGDGQMDPKLISAFISPITENIADYTKGNRFFYLSSLKGMPWKRIVGNSVLSFVTKVSSGYWNIFDPTNGYTAIRADSLKLINLDSVSKRYFFESDMLFHIGTTKSVVLDIPMEAVYPEDNVSNLNALSNVHVFALGNIKNTFRRIIYNYYIRDFTIASINLILSIVFLVFGFIFGINSWIDSIETNTPATAGVVMLSALPIILGIQFLLSFINYDINSVPKTPLFYRVKKKN